MSESDGIPVKDKWQPLHFLLLVDTLSIAVTICLVIDGRYEAHIVLSLAGLCFLAVQIPIVFWGIMHSIASKSFIKLAIFPSHWLLLLMAYRFYTNDTFGLRHWMFPLKP